MSQLGTGVPGDILSPMGTDLPGFHLSAAVVCASGQSAFVVSAFGQRYTAFRVESLARKRTQQIKGKRDGAACVRDGADMASYSKPVPTDAKVARGTPVPREASGSAAMRFRAPRGWGRTPDAARTPCRRATPWLPPFRSPCVLPSCPYRAPAPPWRSSWSRACCRWRAR